MCTACLLGNRLLSSSEEEPPAGCGTTLVRIQANNVKTFTIELTGASGEPFLLPDRTDETTANQRARFYNGIQGLEARVVNVATS